VLPITLPRKPLIFPAARSNSVSAHLSNIRSFFVPSFSLPPSPASPPWRSFPKNERKFENRRPSRFSEIKSSPVPLNDRKDAQQEAMRACDVVFFRFPVFPTMGKRRMEIIHTKAKFPLVPSIFYVAISQIPSCIYRREWRIERRGAAKEITILENERATRESQNKNNDGCDEAGMSSELAIKSFSGFTFCLPGCKYTITDKTQLIHFAQIRFIKVQTMEK